MAGNPLMKLLPIFKKYGTQIFIALGPLLYLMARRNENKTFIFLYGEEEFARKKQLDDLSNFIKEHSKTTNTTNTAEPKLH